MSNIVISPCCNPDLDLDTALRAYSALGYTQFEAFTSWAKSALDLNADPAMYRAQAQAHDMRFTSMHLPPIKADDFDATLEQAIAATRFAGAIGATVVLFKASDRPTYIKAAGPYLDAIEGLGVTPVLQNHAGSPITTPDDFREVIEGIADPRMKTLLEVGYFHYVGVHWRDGYNLLAPNIALVHIKDMIGKQSVPFGAGDVDLPGLLEHLQAVGYTGNIVVEMEVVDKANTLKYLADARNYLAKLPGVEL
jgi:sugar phosphate isomerase/epimerase